MKKALGWIFVGVASLLWIICIIVPFLSFSVGLKAGIIGTCIIMAEIMFWLGAVLIGKNIWQYLKKRNQHKGSISK